MALVLRTAQSLPSASSSTDDDETSGSSASSEDNQSGQQPTRKPLLAAPPPPPPPRHEEQGSDEEEEEGDGADSSVEFGPNGTLSMNAVPPPDGEEGSDDDDDEDEASDSGDDEVLPEPGPQPEKNVPPAEIARSPQPKRKAPLAAISESPQAKRKAAEAVESPQWKRPQAEVTGLPEAAAPVEEDGHVQNNGNADIEKQFMEKTASYYYLGKEVIALDEVQADLFKEPFLKLGDDKARALDTKIKKQGMAEIRLFLRRRDLEKELVKTLLDLLK
ncbi:hypothetical protein GUJ93_ZPchr0009g2208 [Zizania palustris]|uniref:Uncharacterized protein n=1 Tax=Zizania palustris TaxID=103762 RepID=A0A8J5RHP0_ZIZPA|nr:hypothetical protein GUJ93_ZPchr0009g2208 [Zizania palustris]